MGTEDWDSQIDQLEIHEAKMESPLRATAPRRKPEAILIPYEAYERYEALARQRARLDDVLSAAQSVQVELPGAFSPEHDREVSAYVDGEISAAELYHRSVARYRRP
jgi:hypothetical protein